MSPINIPTIEEKLAKLGEVIDKLEQCKRAPREDFMIDFQISDSAMHNLILDIEIIVDIGNHILSEAFQIKASEYAEVIKKLGEAGVTAKEFAEANADMAKFRNLIVHQYGEIDMEKVYRNLQKTPDIFRQFAKYYLEFLEKNNLN